MNEDKDKMAKWKVLNSEYVNKEPWGTLRVDHIQSPSGTEIPRYFVNEYDNWINVIAITKDAKIVLVKQYRHGIQEELLEIPAGVCESSDHDPMESAKRELLEETGYGNGVWSQLMVISANASSNNNRCFCFLAKDVELLSKKQNLDSTEELSIELMDLKDLRKSLEDNIFLQATQVAPLWKFIASDTSEIK